MDKQSLEERVAQLEKQVASLEGIYLTHLRMDALRVVQLEIKVESFESRLKDLDKIEKLVFDAYVQTHPEAQETILQIDRTVPYKPNGSLNSSKRRVHPKQTNMAPTRVAPFTPLRSAARGS